MKTTWKTTIHATHSLLAFAVLATACSADLDDLEGDDAALVDAFHADEDAEGHEHDLDDSISLDDDLFAAPGAAATVATNLFSGTRIETPLYLSDANGLNPTQLYTISLDNASLEAERTHLHEFSVPSLDIAIDQENMILWGVQATNYSDCDTSIEKNNCGLIVCLNLNDLSEEHIVGHSGFPNMSSAGIDRNGNLWATARTYKNLYRVALPTTCDASTVLPEMPSPDPDPVSTDVVDFDVLPLKHLVDGTWTLLDVSSSDLVVDKDNDMWIFNNNPDPIQYGLFHVNYTELGKSHGSTAYTTRIGPDDPAEAPTGPITGLAFRYEGAEQLVGSQRGADDAVVHINRDTGAVEMVLEQVEGGVGVQQNGGGMAGMVPELDTMPCENGANLYTTSDTYYGRCGFYTPGTTDGSFTQQFVGNRASWLLNSTSEINVRYEGVIRTPGWHGTGTSSNADVGLVFGYNAPSSHCVECDLKTFLFKWKRNPSPGNKVKLVYLDTDATTEVPKEHWDANFWNLLQEYSTNPANPVVWSAPVDYAGWNPGEHPFELIYTTAGATLKVWNGTHPTPAIDIEICDTSLLEPGQFGLYSNSTELVEFHSLGMESFNSGNFTACTP